MAKSRKALGRVIRCVPSLALARARQDLAQACARQEQLIGQVTVLRQQLDKHGARMDQEMTRLEALTTNHDVLKQAFKNALLLADKKFVKAKNALNYVFRVLWRLEDYTAPKNHLLMFALSEPKQEPEGTLAEAVAGL